MTNRDAQTATITACKVFKVMGTTQDVTECELCGRTELKGTIVLGILDADGNVESVTHYGSNCGARAAGWTTKDVRAAAKTADDERERAETAAQRAKHKASIAARDTWIVQNIGRDALDNPQKYGFSGPYDVVKAYRAATAA